MRVAVVLLSILALPAALSGRRASAQSEAPEPLRAPLERARAADSATDYAAALALYRDYGERCLAGATVVLEPTQPCADVPAALSRAFDLARALGDAGAAEHIAAAFSDDLLYAEPRESTRVGWELARMLLDLERPEDADAALRRWARLHPDVAPGQLILADALRARIAHAAGNDERATTYWRRVDRRYADEREALTADGPVPLALVQETVAEARLLRAQPFVERFMATRSPRTRSAHDPGDLWRRVISPWRVRTERRLLLARMALERVYELGSPRHSVVAAARIGAMYGHLADLHDAIVLPQDEWLRVLLRRGEDRPGYDQALVHLQTCVRWARHHGVAPRWARRCEEGLHALDPQRYPLPDELSGHAEYLPLAAAPPPVR